MWYIEQACHPDKKAYSMYGCVFTGNAAKPVA